MTKRKKRRKKKKDRIKAALSKDLAHKAQYVKLTSEELEKIKASQPKKPKPYSSAKLDLNKSLQELENCDWGEPMYNSNLVVTCHRLRRVPLRLFNAGDLRIMIGQNISLEFLVPIALKHLHRRPFVEGNFYPGDLLKNVLSVEADFWVQYPEYGRELHQIVKKIFLMGQKKKKRFEEEVQLVRALYQLFSLNFPFELEHI